MKAAAVIIPTTGAIEARAAIRSVLEQSHRDTHAYVIIDGPEFVPQFERSCGDLPAEQLRKTVLPENVGRNAFYGHRVFAAFSHLVNADYVLYLDQDNWFDPDHVASAIETIESQGVDWSYALRKICDRSGTFLMNDDCE